MRNCIRVSALAALALLTSTACRNHMPHSLTWPGGGLTKYSHPKPPEGGYYKNWDPWAERLEVTPLESVNPVRTQHYLIATVKDGDGDPLPNRRVEWILNRGGVGDIVEVDESGWRSSRGYKVTNDFAVSHTNNCDHVLDMGTEDPNDDVHLERGQTWCVITSPIEGDTYVTVYAPGIYDRTRHKVFAVKHWSDVEWELPPPAVNPIGTTHELTTRIFRHSDQAPLTGYSVTYRILSGPAATFEQGGGDTATVQTNAAGEATVVLRQVTPVEGENEIAIEVMRPEDRECCKPAAQIARGTTRKTWVGPQIACEKTGPATAMAGQELEFVLRVTNPSDVTATEVVVTDTLPAGLAFVSAQPAVTPSGQTLSWNLGSLNGGQSQNITLRVRAERSGTYENCAEVRGAHDVRARCCASVAVVTPALALDKQCPREVLLCEPIEYAIIVRNTGDGRATNVRVVDQLPDGLTVEGGRNVLESAVGDLGPGEARELRFTARATRTGQFENRVSATGADGLSAETTCTTLVRQPVLEVRKTAPEMRFLGRPVEVEIVVTNSGDAPARNTVLVDPVPTAARFDSASDNGQFAEGRLTWQLGTIEPGQSRTVTAQFTARERGEIRNTATATAVCAEASGTSVTVVQGVPAILLEVVDQEDPIEIGAEEVYTITVTNQGSARATNVVIECTIPPAQDYVSADGPTPVTAEGKQVRFAATEIAPKANAVYRVIVRGNSRADARFFVRLTSDQTTEPVEETESTHVY